MDYGKNSAMVGGRGGSLGKPVPASPVMGCFLATESAATDLRAALNLLEDRLGCVLTSRGPEQVTAMKPAAVEPGLLDRLNALRERIEHAREHVESITARLVL